MDHQRIALGMGQWLMAKPFDERFGLAVIEYIPDRIGGRCLAGTTGHGEQVDIVITKHRDRMTSSGSNEHKDIGRSGSAIDQIAHEPEAVGTWPYSNSLNEGLKTARTALNIADCVGGHNGIVEYF